MGVFVVESRSQSVSLPEATAPTDIALTDGELLARFCDSGDEAGFRAIVERYAAMVSSVCLSVLRNRADAEDAFQATFFVLARKARTVRERTSLSAWLHRVALRSALAALRKRQSRPVAELPVDDVLPQIALQQISSRAAVSALHEELDRLPEKYRLTLIACYLEGASRAEAARKLRITEAALKTRLERARRMLRRRLGKLGFAAIALACMAQAASGATPAPAGPLVAQALLQAMSAATVSPQVISATVTIAMQVKHAWSQVLAAAAGTQASLSLAQGVLNTMLIATALKTASSVVLGGCLGLFAMTALAWADDPPKPAVVQNADDTREAVLVLAQDAAAQQSNQGEGGQAIAAVVVPQEDSRQILLWHNFTQEPAWATQQRGESAWILDPREMASVKWLRLANDQWRTTLQQDAPQAKLETFWQLDNARRIDPAYVWGLANTQDQGVWNVQWRYLATRAKSPEELSAENDQLKARVDELERTLKLHDRIQRLEEENEQLRQRLRQAEQKSDDGDN